MSNSSSDQVHTLNSIMSNISSDQYSGLPVLYENEQNDSLDFSTHNTTYLHQKFDTNTTMVDVVCAIDAIAAISTSIIVYIFYFRIEISHPVYAVLFSNLIVTAVSALLSFSLYFVKWIPYWYPAWMSLALLGSCLHIT